MATLSYSHFIAPVPLSLLSVVTLECFNYSSFISPDLLSSILFSNFGSQDAQLCALYQLNSSAMWLLAGFRQWGREIVFHRCSFPGLGPCLQQSLYPSITTFFAICFFLHVPILTNFLERYCFPLWFSLIGY